MDKHRLLRDALIWDTETTDLARGSGVHELAIYSFDQQTVHEYLLRPNYVQTAGETAQDITRLVSSSGDVHVGKFKERTWVDVLRATLSMEKAVAANASDEEVIKALSWARAFLHEGISAGKYQRLVGKRDDIAARRDMLTAQGITLTSQEADIRDVLKAGGDVENLIKGKTLWGANLGFEAKQIGAVLGAMEAQATAEGQEFVSLKRVLETASTSADPFYVTGREVNIARVKSQISGDWTETWKAYLQYTPKAGETATRDIQDVLRAMYSYGEKLGIANAQVGQSTSIDMAYRLFGSLEDNVDKARSMLTTREAHTAAVDASVFQRYVLEKGVEYTSALQEAHEGTELGKAYLQQAAVNEGPLAKVSTFFARQEYLHPTEVQGNFFKRLERAAKGLIREGTYYEEDGFAAVKFMRQQTPSGAEQKIPVLRYDRMQINDLDAFAAHLEARGAYEGIDVKGHVEEVKALLSGSTSREKDLHEWLASKRSTYVDSVIQAEQDTILSLTHNSLGKRVTRANGVASIVGRAADALEVIKPVGKIGAWGAAVAALAVGATAWSMSDGNAKHSRDEPSLVTYNYDQWLSKQQEYYDSSREQGIAAQTRKFTTDFGSPYRGIVGSQVVFANQELHEEREKWIREQYGATHFDPQVGLFGAFGPFRDAMKGGYHILNGGREAIPGEFAGTTSKRLMQVNLARGNWKISADDADTITIKRGGIRGAVRSFFGLNKGYSVRLAGIDSPEVSHGGKVAQPHADASTKVLQQILADSGGNLNLLYDPTQSTYGRSLGILYAGKTNINYELVKRGAAAYLPYGKREDAIINYGQLHGLEKVAAAQQQGMWAEPWAKAYRDISERSGNRVTFNTFTNNSKVAQNISLMNTLSFMEQAQAQGMYNASHSEIAAGLGKSATIGEDKVRPVLFDAPNAHYNAYLGEMLRDSANFTATKGTGHYQNKFRTRGSYGKLNSHMALDTMGYTNSIWTRRRLQAFETYGDGREKVRGRRERMAASQRQANQTMYMNPVNHYMM